MSDGVHRESHVAGLSPANPLWGKKEKGGPDGPGQHIVVWRMTEETRVSWRALRRDVDKMAPEVGLMARHFRAGRTMKTAWTCLRTPRL